MEFNDVAGLMAAMREEFLRNLQARARREGLDARTTALLLTQEQLSGMWDLSECGLPPALDEYRSYQFLEWIYEVAGTS